MPNAGDNQRASGLSSYQGLYVKPHCFSRLVHPIVEQLIESDLIRIGLYPLMLCHTTNEFPNMLQVVFQMSQVINHELTKCNRSVFVHNPYVVDAFFIDGPDDSS